MLHLGRAALGADPLPTLSLFNGDINAFLAAKQAWCLRHRVGSLSAALGASARSQALPSARVPAAPGTQAAIPRAGTSALLLAASARSVQAGAAPHNFLQSCVAQHLAAAQETSSRALVAPAAAAPVAAIPVAGEKRRRAALPSETSQREGAPGWCEAAAMLVGETEVHLQLLRQTVGAVSQDDVERPARYAAAAALAPFILPGMAAFALKLEEPKLLAMSPREAMVCPRPCQRWVAQEDTISALGRVPCTKMLADARD